MKTRTLSGSNRYRRGRARLFQAGLACAVMLLAQWSGDAQPNTRPRPAPPPKMPEHFDRATVQQLLDEVDQQHNATILRAGYFMRRGKTELPQSEGIELLKAAIAREAAGSKRWFILQSLYGFASFRVPEASPQEGVAIYGAIFDRSAEADKAGAAYQLQQAINEYTFTVIGRMNDLNMHTETETQQVLLKAWNAYVGALTPDKPGQRKRRKPDWAKAIDRSHSTELFLPQIEKSLNDATVLKTFEFLQVAAAVYRPTKPQRALELLQQARPLLSHNDPDEDADFYKSLVDLLVQEKQLGEAIAAQKEYLKLAGRGRARLVLLHIQNKDEVAAEAIIKTLSVPNANEREIVELGKELQGLAEEIDNPNVLAGERAIKLLQGYLDGPRIRNLDQELIARQSLGVALMKQKRYPEALKRLDISGLKLPDMPRTKMLERSIQTLRESIETQMKD